MDDMNSVQIKIVRMIIMADNFSQRVGCGHKLSPTEALTYKALSDFIRAHARLSELHTLLAIEQLEGEIYGQEPEQPDPERDQPPGRMASDSDGQSDQGAGGAEEDEWLGD